MCLVYRETLKSFTEKMCEDQRNIEFQSGGKLSPGLNLLTGEDQLSHLNINISHDDVYQG